MRNKDLFKKAALTGILSITIGLNTACSLQFNEDIPKEVLNESSANITEAVSNIEETVQNTDFTDEESVAVMSESIATVSNDLAYDIDESLSEDYAQFVFEEAHVKRVVDGDTIVVDIDNKGEFKVRLIGVNTPESVAPPEYLEAHGIENTEEGTYASIFTKELLSGCDVVYLQTDVSDTDRYDRLLRYVWLEVPKDMFDLAEVQDKMVNAILVKEGYAEAVRYEPDTMYAEYFEELETYASENADYE